MRSGARQARQRPSRSPSRWEALEIDPATGLRVYSEVGLGLPRKNGKSMQASAAAHYFPSADGEAGPEVDVAAAARRRAGHQCS
jgi:phage terminase large subunit-like protein